MSSNINNIIDSSENKLSKWKDDLKEIKNGIKDEINDTLSSIEHITGAASERSPLLNKMKRGKDNTNDNTNNNEGRSNSSPSKLSYTPNEEEAAEDTAAAAAAVVTDDEEHTTASTPTSMNTATTKSNSKQKVNNNNNNNSQGGITQLILITLLSISTIYQTILHKLDIVSNSIPFIVALHWCTFTFLIGMSSSSSSSSSSSWRDGGGVAGMMSEEDAEGRSSLLDDQHTQQERHVTFSTRQPSEQQQVGLQKRSSTRELIRRIPMGRRHYAKMKESLFPQLERRDSPLEEFFTNLKPAFKNITPRFGIGSGLDGSSGGEVTPLSEGMMLRLLKYSPDFGRRKSQMGEIDNSMLASCRRVQEEGEEGNSESEEEQEEVNYEMGTAPLGNIRASKLERDFGEVVVPMCKFRGMDFFVGDFPEKEIWKQPLLLK